ncbi:MAG: RpoL/Rpb11 RNA polymerase subunit family protein [Candidatus Micrarchaeia archaeon]|jgi:DNA-directed RNA polymerase subunit L
MNVQIIKEEKDFIEVKLVGEDLGLANMVAQELISTGAAEFAYAALDHPITTNPVIRVRGKDAKKEIAKAAAACAKKLDALSVAPSGKSKKKD